MDEGPLLEDCDLIVSSATPSLIVKAYKMVAKRMLELDKEMIDGLQKIGLHVTWARTKPATR